RLLADRLTKHWGQSVVVENRPGGDGSIGITAVLNAHDDHTLMFGPSSAFVAAPYLHGKLPYNPADLLPVARLSVTLVGVAPQGADRYRPRAARQGQLGNGDRRDRFSRCGLREEGRPRHAEGAVSRHRAGGE